MLLGVISCHLNVLIACPITEGEICNTLKSIDTLGLWVQIIEFQGFNVPISFVNKIQSGSRGLLAALGDRVSG